MSLSCPRGTRARASCRSYPARVECRPPGAPSLLSHRILHRLIAAILLAGLCFPTGSLLAAVVFFDDFSGTTVDPTKWAFPTGSPSFYGRTQIRAYYPPVSGGVLRLRLDTHNPTAREPGDSFYGSEIYTRERFSRGAGLRAEVRARLESPIVAGLVGGAFFYRYFKQTGLHSEIDFELLSNFLDKVQTNVYAQEPFGAGHPVMVPAPDITGFNLYRIDWLPNRVRWYIDDVLVREETSVIPKEDLEFHLNFWGPDCQGWAIACNPDLRPAPTPDKNQTFFFVVDWVRISEIDEPCWECLPSRGGWRAILP